MSWWVFALLLATAGSAAWTFYLRLQLRRARETTEISRRINDRLFSSIGHEVRTPMTGIVGMSALLQETELTDRQRNYLRTLRTSSESLLEIIEDITAFGKLQSRRLKLEQSAFDLRACVEGALAEIADDAARKRLELGYWIDGGTSETLIGDGQHLGRILKTLLANGVKLTESGEVTVEVSTVSRGDLDEFTFSVRDTGSGWQPEEVARLLDPFGQADAKLSRRFGGVGLGLSVAKGLAELMGGRLWLAETAATGSRFCFTIVAETAPGPDRSDLYQTHPILSGRRVLVVEDNAGVRALLHRQLEILGMEPGAAATAAEALEHLESRQADAPFELAIVDRQTAQEDGIGWAERLNDECRRQNLSLLHLTALGESPTNGNSSPRVLGKPLRASQLVEALVEVIDAR